MHLGSLLLVAWLVIGGLAASQRGDFHRPVDCSNVSSTALTILAGPLNYAHVNPHVHCSAPWPSN
jgi:hypothetical protein